MTPNATPPNSSAKLLKIITNYLKGKSLKKINRNLQDLADNHRVSCKDVCRLTPINEHHDKILEILFILNINATKDEQSLHYKLLKKQTVYELLAYLARHHHPHVRALLKRIERTTPKPNWVLYSVGATLFSAGISAVIYSQKANVEQIVAWLAHQFPLVMQWIDKTLSTLRNIPILGLIYNGLTLFWSWYRILSNDLLSTHQKGYKLLFKTLTIGLVIGSYVLSFLAAGSMPMAAASLFVLSASIDIVKSIFFFYKNNQSLSVFNNGSHEELLPPARAEETRLRHRKAYMQQTIGIKLIAAILTTGLVALWVFAPPSLVLTTCCLMVITFVGISKQLIINRIKNKCSEKLQTNLKRIFPDTPDERAEALARREACLKERENALEHTLTHEKKAAYKEGIKAALNAVRPNRRHSGSFFTEPFLFTDRTVDYPAKETPTP